MTTLREAAQQALEALLEVNYDQAYAKEVAALRAALAEPVQEPVAWRYKPMVGSPWSLSDDGYYISCKRDSGYIIEPLYTAPPQRKPLTTEQILDLFDSHNVYGSKWVEFARAVERAHGIGGKDE